MEDKWTYSYIDKLQDFVNTINLRTNRVIKLAPNKVTQKDVPRLISLRAEQSLKLVRRPKLYVGNFVRIAKIDIPFRKYFTCILGVKGIRDGTGYHIGYKESSHIHSTLTSQNFISDCPVNISTGTQMMFIYLDIIHYQIVGDTKAPLLRVIDTNRRVKNGYVCSIEPNHRKIFSNLDYKKTPRE